MQVLMWVCNTVWMRTQRSSLTESSVRTHESLYTLAAPGPVQKAAVMGPRRVVTRRPHFGQLQRKLVKAGRNEDRWATG
jgi:hypothetical protein